MLASITTLVFFLTSSTSSQPTSKLSCSRDAYTVIPNNGSGIWPYREYKSSDATPPELKITSNGTALAPGSIFFGQGDSSSTPGVKEAGPLIMTSGGDLIWAGPDLAAANFRVQTLFGNQVISFWLGSGGAESSDQASHGYGSVAILDEHYDTVFTVCPKLNITLRPGATAACGADTHESYITPRNTMLVTMYNTTTADLSSVGGPENGWVLDPLVVEVNLTNNEPVFIWSPLSHVPLNTSHSPLLDTGLNSSNPYDWFHTNSIQSHDGHYLINARGTWTSYYVSQNGTVEWQINGVDGGDFGSLPEGAQFSWQHNARVRSLGQNQLLYTNFADNNAEPDTNNQSLGLGLVLSLPPSAKTPPTLYSLLDDQADPVVSYAEGSYQILPNDRYFVGYGSRPFMKEFSLGSEFSGDVLWSAQFGYNDNKNSAQSYRAFKQEWSATPSTTPSLVVAKAGVDDGLATCAGGSQWRGYVSWNGATNVRGYSVRVGNTTTNLREAMVVQKMGFETEFVIPNGVNYVQVVAKLSAEPTEAGKKGQSNVIAVL